MTLNAQQALRLFWTTGLPQAYTYGKAAGRRDQPVRQDSDPAPAVPTPEKPSKGAKP